LLESCDFLMIGDLESAGKGGEVMGFFDFLFGGGKKDKHAREKQKPARAPSEAVETKEAVMSIEIIAAISAGIHMTLTDDDMIAAITAAVHHAANGGMPDDAVIAAISATIRHSNSTSFG